MAEVTVFTAARSQEIEDTSIVNGRIEASNGHLILIANNGTEKDAGAISFYQATETAAGSVELASNLETQQGIDNQRAVTPAGLASLSGYRFFQQLRYTSSMTFQKSVYTGLKLIRVIVIGGGGGGGGAAAASTGNHSAGGGGGGGGYAEKILFENEIADNVTITVGAGGGGGTSAGGAASSGGTSSFGTQVIATGGFAGGTFANSALMLGADAGRGGNGTAGDIMARGGCGTIGSGHATLGHSGSGGSTALGGGGESVYGPGGASSLTGSPGGLYGGGGGGAAVNASGAGAAGGAGGAGIVLVEVYV